MTKDKTIKETCCYAPEIENMNLEDKKRIRVIQGNDRCCDCSSLNPTWVSISHATLICMECSGRHRGLGVHISFVRSLDLDSFSEKDVKKLSIGGNRQFLDFVKDQGGGLLMDSSCSARERYESDIARLYREVLKARLDGSNEPSMEDLLVKEAGKKSEIPMHYDPSESRGGVVKMQSISNSSSCRTSSSKKSATTSTQRFVGGFKYWTKRLVFLPMRNNRRLTLSMLALYAMSRVASKSLKSTQDGASMIIVNMISKLFSMLFFTAASSTFTLSCLSINWLKVHRQEAFKSSLNAFQDRQKSARAKRNPLYDLYFPPNVSIGDKVSKAVIFFPDILVDKSAYATVIGKLSDAGILVAVLNADPLRIPTQMEHSGKPISSSTTVLKVSFEVQKLLGIQVEEWVLMSHGEGACAITDIIRNAPAALRGSGGKLRKPRCVFWSPTSMLHDLSQVSASVLVVNTCSDEGVMNSAGSDISKMLPKPTSETRVMQYVIGGGSHSGFAHYGPGTFRKEISKRTKSLDDQQKEARELTVDFIMQREPSTSKKD